MINAYLIFENAKNDILTEAKSSVKNAKKCIKLINTELKPSIEKQLKLVKNNSKKTEKTIQPIIEILIEIDKNLIIIIDDMRDVSIDKDELDNYIQHIRYIFSSYISSFSTIAQEYADGTFSNKLFKDIFKNDGTIWGNMFRNTVKHIGDKGKKLVSKDTISGKAKTHKLLSDMFMSASDVLKAANILETILNQYINKRG
jgi:hypothetical protein